MADDTKHGDGCKHPPCCAHGVESVIVTEAAGLCPFHAAALARVLRLRMREFMDELGYPQSSQELAEREQPKETIH